MNPLETLKSLDNLLDDCTEEVNHLPGATDVIIRVKMKELHNAIIRANRICRELVLLTDKTKGKGWNHW